MLKDLFDKGRCALGFHAEAWKYAREGSCQQTSTCTRCQAVSQRVLHDWAEAWAFVSANDCQMARPCRRCREQEITFEHEWAPPSYRAEGSCEQIHSCARCGAEKEAATIHVWTAWAYDAEDSCHQTQRCARCNAAGASSRIAHDWNQWQHSPFYDAQVRVCGHCAEMIFDLDPADEAGASLSMQRVAATVAQVMTAPDIAGLREGILTHRREMLSPATDRYLRYAIDSCAAEPSKREPLTALAALLERCRAEGAESVLPPPPVLPPPLPPSAFAGHTGATAASPDARLTGQWRHTESLSSGGVSLVTDTHLVLDRNGRFEWWSKSAGSMGSSTSAADTGNWSVADGSLRLAFDDGRRNHLRVTVDGDSMLCPDERRYRLWHRIAR